MLRLATDQNFDERVVRALRVRLPGVDIVRARDVGLDEAPDPVLLEWAAAHGRVLLTRDKRTMADFAYDRARAGLPMPGVVAIPQSLPLGRAIEELVLFIGASIEGEWEGQVTYLPISR